jgi:hypothetical protein
LLTLILQTGTTGPMETLPVIPPLAPSRGGPARWDRYPPGETMKPAPVDTAVRRRTPTMRAELLNTGTTIRRVI